MTNEEYDKAVSEITKSVEDAKNIAEVRRKSVIREYALSHNKKIVGDIITDGRETIRIEYIQIVPYTIVDKYPQCVYIGGVIRKDLKPLKKPKIGEIYQSKIVE